MDGGDRRAGKACITVLSLGLPGLLSIEGWRRLELEAWGISPSSTVITVGQKSRISMRMKAAEAVSCHC